VSAAIVVLAAIYLLLIWLEQELSKGGLKVFYPTFVGHVEVCPRKKTNTYPRQSPSIKLIFEAEMQFAPKVRE